MKCYVLYLGSSATQTKHVLEHQGWEVNLFEGFDNSNKWSLSTNHTYEIDNPGTGYKVGPKHIGISMAHFILWRALEAFGKDDYYHIMEDDIRLRQNWRQNLQEAMSHLPEDWDLLYPGNCCAKSEPENLVAGNLYRGCPLCTHWYTVRHKALRTLIETNSAAWGPLDIQMQISSAKKLKVYSIIPRLADQNITVLED
jgi:GR25 family glycosyltransferase involved in LPS biosynthesis